MGRILDLGVCEGDTILIWGYTESTRQKDFLIYFMIFNVLSNPLADDLWEVHFELSNLSFGTDDKVQKVEIFLGQF